MAADYSNTTIIIPTLNETGNIGLLLNNLVELYPKINIIVADDGSKDGTQQIVKNLSDSFSNIILLDRRNEKIKGLCASVIDAAKIATTENLVVMDGDLQHPPEKVNELIAALDNHSLIIGTRNKIKEPWSLHRKLLSVIATKLAKLRVHYNDPMSGFFAAKTKLITEILNKHGHKFEKTGYKVLFDMLKYLPKDTGVAEVNYDFLLREHGKTKIGIRQIFAFLKALVK
ncbi:glycosyltransferase [Candidatus Woesearchaeota archaeon]|nr:glycosyltransferase [Candidatus Woesearchaeota archaeon]